MRKFLIGGIVLVAMLVVVVVVAVANVNTYLEENRETLAGLASDAAGRAVRFEGAEVAFSNGLAVRVVGLRVAEDPRFDDDDFLSLDEAYVGVRIWPALQRRIEVSGIRLDSPSIHVIQTAKGFNFSSIGAGAEGETAPEQGADRDPGEEAAGFAVAIAALEIVDGTLLYEDRRTPDGLSLIVDDLTTSGTDLALDGPIALDFSGNVRSLKPEDEGLSSRVEGDVALASLDPVQGEVTLRSPRMHPAIFGVRLEEGTTPEHLDALAVDVDLGPGGVQAGIPISVRSGGARLSGLDVDAIVVDLVFRDTRAGSKLDLAQVAVDLAGGRVDLEGDVLLGEPGASPFALQTRLTALDTGRLAAAFLDVPAGALSGTLGGDIALSGDGLEWESLKRSLVGQLELEVGEGALEQVNVLDDLVQRMTADPGLGRLAAASIRDVVPDALAGDRTPFEGVDMALEILDGAIHARDLKLEAGDFTLSALGKVGLDGNVAADGTILLSQTLSRKILDKADELAPLLADGDRMVLPLRIEGTASAPRITPDLTALSAAAKKELTNRAARELSDAIFGKRKDRAEGDPESRPPDERDAAEDLIKEGLGRFLGR